MALLDCTVKVFFADSLKFWLSLYGHKLPVLSMDISSDSALLASGSADKNLKVRQTLPAHNTTCCALLQRTWSDTRVILVSEVLSPVRTHPSCWW